MQAVELDGATIAYEVAGDGEPLVLVAGCGQPAAAWQTRLGPRLVAAGYKVITFDNRGRGALVVAQGPLLGRTDGR